MLLRILLLFGLLGFSCATHAQQNVNDILKNIILDKCDLYEDSSCTDGELQKAFYDALNQQTKTAIISRSTDNYSIIANMFYKNDSLVADKTLLYLTNKQLITGQKGKAIENEDTMQRKVVFLNYDIDKEAKTMLPNTTNERTVPLLYLEETFSIKKCLRFSSDEKIKKCTLNDMYKHVVNNFDTSSMQNLGLEGTRTRVQADFFVNTEGAIEDITIKAPHSLIKKEVEHILKSYPKLRPGSYAGNAVRSKVTLQMNLSF